MPSNLRIAFFASAALVVALVTGCMHPGPYDPARTGPFFSPTNFVGEPSLGGIRRVVLLPIWTSDRELADSAADLDPVLVSALQRENRFEVVTLSRSECQRRYHVPALSATGALPRDLLPALQRDFAADAALFVDLTVFEPYRPLAIGLRAKLTRLDSPRIVWSFDQLFSADNPLVANAARHSALDRDTGGVPADLTSAALESPARFAGYAAGAMFATLPPVTLPVATTAGRVPPGPP